MVNCVHLAGQYGPCCVVDKFNHQSALLCKRYGDANLRIVYGGEGYAPCHDANNDVVSDSILLWLRSEWEQVIEYETINQTLLHVACLYSCEETTWFPHPNVKQYATTCLGMTDRHLNNDIMTTVDTRWATTQIRTKHADAHTRTTPCATIHDDADRQILIPMIFGSLR
jgi:hypothetical protein